MPAKPHPGLTEEQRRLLAKTRQVDLQKVFKGFPREYLRAEWRKAKAKYPDVSIEADATERSRRAAERARVDEINRLHEERDRLRKELRTLRGVMDGRGYSDIRVRARSSKKRESTAVALLSDWHCEELVTAEETNGLNRYDLKVFDRRADSYFVNLAKIVNKEQHDAVVRNGVLWLGGDLISGNIHLELLETNQLGPMQAAIRAQNKIAGGIRYLLDNTDLAWTVPCSVGNHERITKKRRIKTAIDNSLATFVYYSLAAQFEGEKRVTFRLPDAYFTYADVHGYTCRFHHGDAVRYGGGIGGLHIPLRRKIGFWNKSRRADYDFIGHFHQFMDGGYYVVNGSLIGYSAYAVEIGAEFEPPRQAFVMIDSRHGKTGVCPIIVSEQ